MLIANQQPAPNERRWTSGSYVAAGFALFLFLYNFGKEIISTTWPTDGWRISNTSETDLPEVTFVDTFLNQPTPIRAGDQLQAINGKPVQQIFDDQHAFFSLKPPNWPDGTQLLYTLLREGQTISVEVTVRRASFWEYLYVYRQAQSSDLVQLFGSLFFFTVSVVVFLLRPGNRAAHALLFIGVAFFFNAVPGNFSGPTLFFPTPPVSIPFDAWTLAINPSLMYLVLVFPHPKALLRKFPKLTIMALYLTWPFAFNTAYLLNLDNRLGYLDVAFAIYPIQVILLMIITAVSLVHTALKVRNPVERSQFKWMLAGIFSFVFLGIGGWLVSSYLFPTTISGGNWLITTLGWFLLPICLAIAILRYRLFDIDVIIRRTLVYSILSAALGLIYFGGVTLLQNLFTALSGQSSPIAVVISTLGIAALFSPLRRYIQEFIDRRFYRSKYDAEQALSSFARVARDVVDIEHLSIALLETVETSIAPEKLSLMIFK